MKVTLSIFQLKASLLDTVPASGEDILWVVFPVPWLTGCQFVSVHLYQRYVRHLQQDSLSQLMNGPIRKKLKIIPEDCSWGGRYFGDLIKGPLWGVEQ